MNVAPRPDSGHVTSPILHEIRARVESCGHGIEPLREQYPKGWDGHQAWAHDVAVYARAWANARGLVFGILADLGGES